MSHTPGPFEIGDRVDAAGNPDKLGSFVAIDSKDWLALAIVCIDNEGTNPQGMANARLFAAAPDLLGALKEVVAISDRKHNAWDKAHIAISKAEGRS